MSLLPVRLRDRETVLHIIRDGGCFNELDSGNSNLNRNYLCNMPDNFRKKARLSSSHPRGPGVWLNFTITV